MQKNHIDNHSFTPAIHKKDIIIKELKKKGCRITNQRLLLIEIILSNECSCCKEIYYQALLKDPTIGIATVYRLIKTLEDIGAINRKNMYHITYDHLDEISDGEIILIDEENTEEIQSEELYHVLKRYLQSKGYIHNQEISVLIKKGKQGGRRL
ncbi:MAG: hypothetical protein K0S47_1206 [Herbinix sp.]|jgi:Fur family ferric uptake transcriptional regulator|nr:hypothetical protein [Herbinix sp.]